MDSTDIKEENKKPFNQKIKISSMVLRYKRSCTSKYLETRLKIKDFIKDVRGRTSKQAKNLVLLLKDPQTYKSIGVVVRDNLINFFKKTEHNIKDIYIKVKDPKLLAVNTAYEIKFKYYQLVGTIKHKLKMFYTFKYLVYKENITHKFKYIISLIVKHKLSISITTASLAIILSGLLIYNANIGYEVTFNGQALGIVKDETVMSKAVGVVSRELSQWYDKDMVFKQDVSYEKTFINKDELLVDVNDTVNALYNTNIELSVQGAVVVIDGQEVATLSNRQEAEEALHQVLAPYVSENGNQKLVGDPIIKEKYEVVEKLVNYADIKELDNVVSLISQGTEEMLSYKVQKGDTSWDIAINRGVNIDQLEKANPDMDITNLHDGDVLNLSVAKPYLTVDTQKEVTMEEKIDYGTQYKKDDTVYVGKTKVTSPGVKGIKTIVALISYENGKEISRDIVSEEVTQEPVDEIVAKGTKPLPPAKGTGRFQIPTSGRISAINKPGTHAGGRAVDIANRRGTSIYAADSGTVVMATYKGSYGNCIIIDHGNGYSTRYAHLSSFGVSVGARVTKGQYIAAMGSTGNSTGPHLHFEIMVNGQRQRILNYFGFMALGRHVSP